MPFRNGEDMWALISPCSNKFWLFFMQIIKKKIFVFSFKTCSIPSLLTSSGNQTMSPASSACWLLFVQMAFSFSFFSSLSSHDWGRDFPLVCKAASVLLKSLLKILNHLGNLPKSWQQSLMCRNFCVLHWPKFCCNFIVPPSACLWLLSLA